MKKYLEFIKTIKEAEDLEEFKADLEDSLRSEEQGDDEGEDIENKSNLNMKADIEEDITGLEEKKVEIEQKIQTVEELLTRIDPEDEENRVRLEDQIDKLKELMQDYEERIAKSEESVEKLSDE